MKEMPYISIIVPVYNAEKYIEECIDSILCQSYRNFELLLINDGSVDQSGSICENYALQDERVHVFHQKNSGVSVARNKGLDVAKGEWVTFIDADDCIGDEYLAQMIQHDSNDLVVCSYRCIPGSSNVLQLPDQTYHTKKDIGNCLKQAIDSFFFGSPWCKIFKLSIIKTHGIHFDPKIKSGEDTLFVQNYLVKIDSLRTVSYRGYHYRMGVSASLSSLSLELDTVVYILNRFTNSINAIENYYQVDFSDYRNNISIHILNKYLINLYLHNLYGIRKRLINLSQIAVVSACFKATECTKKGRRHKVFDYLILHKKFWLLAICVKLRRRKTY